VEVFTQARANSDFTHKFGTFDHNGEADLNVVAPPFLWKYEHYEARDLKSLRAR
jgi:hypothetical protein